MSNQEQQTAILPQGVTAALTELQEFIRRHPDAREVRKAMSVKLVYQGYKYIGNSGNTRCVTGVDYRLETSL